MGSKVTPLVRVEPGEEGVCRELLRNKGFIYVVHEDHSFEDVLSHVIRKEMSGPREERRQELLDILQAMDLSDIPNE